MTATAPQPAAEKPKEPEGGLVRAATIAAGKLVAFTSLGGAGGVGGGVVVKLLDPSGQSTVLAVQTGIWLGGLTGLCKVLADYPIKWLFDWRAESNRVALIETRRQLSWCESERADDRRKMGDLQAAVAQMRMDIDKIRSEHRDEIRQVRKDTIAEINELLGRDQPKGATA